MFENKKSTLDKDIVVQFQPMKRIWLQHYPSEIPHDIENITQPITQNFKECFQKYSHQTAFENYGVKISFQKWNELSDAWASYLTNHCSLKKGDRVAIQMPNTLQLPIAVLGVLKAGLVVVNVNPLYTARELEQILSDSEAKALLIFSHSAHLLNQISTPPAHIIVSDLEDLFSPTKKILFKIILKLKKMIPPYPRKISLLKALEKGKSIPFQEQNIQLEDLAFLQYTGGTTGSPKGAILTHRNIASNWRQCLAWMKPFLKDGKEFVIAPLPLYHIFALMLNVFLLPLYGAHTVLITNPRDKKTFIQTLKKYQNTFTVFLGVNALFKMLVNEETFSSLKLSKLKHCIAGGTAVETFVYNKWKELTNVPIVEGYGLTEASPVVSCNILSQATSQTCGYPLPSTQIRVTQEGVGVNQEGELEIQGPQVMKGYWKKDKETHLVLSSDGWLKTGDIVKINDRGMIHILDRKKDMILVSGFNVFPNEIENIISEHPQVENVAVVAFPDPKSKEVPKAFIVRKNDQLTEEEVIEFCRKSLTAYKIPKYIEFVESLPHSTVGKVLRRKLKK